MQEGRPDGWTMAAFSAAVVLAGLNVVAVRFSNRELAPLWGAGLRFFAAGLLLLALVAGLRLVLPRGRALLGAMVYGALAFGGAYAFFYWGLQRVPAGIGALILASVPLTTVLLAWAHGQEPLRLRAVAGGLLAIAGVGLMSFAPVTETVPTLYLLAMVAGTLCGAESAVLAKGFPRAHPVTTNAIGMLTGGGGLLVVSILVRDPLVLPAQATTWLAVGYLVLLGSVSMFVLFLFVLRRWTASATAYILVFAPAVTVFASAWLEGEPVTPGLLLGGALILAGVYVGALSRPRAVAAAGKAS